MAIIVRRNPSRALTLTEPFYRPMRLIDEVERMARQMWDTGRPFALQTGLTHGLDMYEEKDKLVVKTEFPGLTKKDIEISLEDDVLTIKAEKKQEEGTEDTKYYVRERRYGHYSRSVSLPVPVDTENISATFKNGLLEIRLPKTEETKSKQIDIEIK